MMQPFGTNVVLQPIIPTNMTTSSGILLPEKAKSGTLRGTIVAVGPDVEELEVGMVVYYQRFGGTDLTIDGVDYLVVEAQHLLAIDA